MTVLVTGATGFIGRALAARLAKRGETVLCLVRDPAKAAWLRGVPGLEMVRGDIRDRELVGSLVRRVDLVFHLAGLTKARRERDFFLVNAEATGGVAAAAAAAPRPPKVVLVSSLAVAGPRVAAAPAREDEPPAPTNPYGASKLRGEELLEREGIRWTVIRPPWVYGPWDRDTLALFRCAARGFIPLVSGGRMEISMVHVDDLVEAILLAGFAEAADGRTYYVSDGAVHTVAELGALLLAAAGGGRALPVPALVMRLAGFAGDLATLLTGTPSLLGRHKAGESLAPGWVCADERIRSELGYGARVPLAAGVASTFAWYRREGWL